MVHPSVEEMLEHVDSKFTLVTLARLRADDLQNGARPLLDSKSEKHLTIAFEEIAEGKINPIVTEHPRRRKAPTLPVRDYELAA